MSVFNNVLLAFLSPIVPCSFGDIQLVNGMNSSEGRVEICIDGTYGTVCDDSWDNDDAEVVCRQIGYFGGKSIYIIQCDSLSFNTYLISHAFKKIVLHACCKNYVNIYYRNSFIICPLWRRNWSNLVG